MKITDVSHFINYNNAINIIIAASVIILVASFIIAFFVYQEIDKRSSNTIIKTIIITSILVCIVEIITIAIIVSLNSNMKQINTKGTFELQYADMPDRDMNQRNTPSIDKSRMLIKTKDGETIKISTHSINRRNNIKSSAHENVDIGDKVRIKSTNKYQLKQLVDRDSRDDNDYYLTEGSYLEKVK